MKRTIEEMYNKYKTSECVCNTCVSACSNKPGWFLPGEAEKAAKLKGMSFEKFFSEFLAVDYFIACEDIFILSPVVKGNPPGTTFPSHPGGVCIFLKDGRCEIHTAKPFECKLDQHSQDTSLTHEEVAEIWADEKHQSQVAELLGYKPVRGINHDTL